MGALEACRLCQGHSWAAWTKKDAENPSLRCFNPVWKDGTCIWCGSGRISCKLLPKVLQTAYGETLGQKTKNGLICSANKGSMLQKGSVYSYSITATTHWPLFVFIPEDGTYASLYTLPAQGSCRWLHGCYVCSDAAWQVSLSMHPWNGDLVQQFLIQSFPSQRYSCS